MQLSTTLLLCILILSATGGMLPFQRILQENRLHCIFFALCMLALSRFSLVLHTEIRFNFAAVLLPLWCMVWARKEPVSLRMALTAISLALLAVCMGRSRVFAGTHNGILAGFIGGAGAAILADTPKTALAVSVTVPLLTVLFSCLFAIVTGGYASLDLSQPAVLDAQLCALCFGAVLLCLHAVAVSERKEA